MAAYKASLNAHAALDLLISRAILEGKTGTLRMSVPLTDYEDHYEGPKFDDDASNIAIEVELTTRWTEPSEFEYEADADLIEGIESEEEFLSSEEDKEEEEEEAKNGKKNRSGSDSSGH